jgi:outer membrane receptor protein involved in Fe transport
MPSRYPLFILLLLLLPVYPAYGQSVTSSGAAGKITDQVTGDAIPNANILLRHEPTGTTQSANTGLDGRYRFTGMRPGGPYTLEVRKSGYQPLRQTKIQLGLQQTVTLDVKLPPAQPTSKRPQGDEGEEQVFELDEFTVNASDQNLVFVESNQGTNTRIDLETINRIPTVQRSLSDIARLDSRIAVDRETGQISAGGRNTRYNSLLIDGVPTNDSFGLSESGLPALKQPFSLESIAEVKIAHSPYSVENAGFTGAAITAVTKSGTNELSGTVFAFYRDDSMVGDLTEVDSNEIIPFDDFREYTLGISVGGPIIKDKLFYYFLYEKVEETRVRDKPTVDPDQEELDRLQTATQSFQNPFDIGEYRDPQEAVLQDDKILLKLDWNINRKHRFSARYNRTEGSDPTITNGYNSTWYDTEYTLDDVTLELFSKWTPDFNTELRVSLKNQGQVQNNNSDIPFVQVQGISATSLENEGERITTDISFGADEINNLDVDTDIIHFKGTWFLGSHELKFGLQYQATSNNHLELTFPYGRWRYDRLELFEQALGAGNRGVPIDPGNAAGFSLQVPAPGESAASAFTLTQWGAFIEDVWTVNPRLTLTMGFRLDYPEVDRSPPRARPSLEDPPRSFEEVFNASNQNTVDGNATLQPRFGFNYAVTEDRSIQMRGGAGLFYGTAPHIWLATAYVDNGRTKIFYNTGAQQNSPPFSLDPNELVEWLQEAGEEESDLSSVDVNYLNKDFQMPTEWKSNLAFDIRLEDIDAILTLEGQWGWTEQDIHFIHRNLRVKDESLFTGFLPDGRRLYVGNVTGTEPSDRYREEGYANVIELTNTSKGRTYQYTIQLDRPMREQFAWRLAYTYTRNKTVADAFTGGSRLAFNNWRSNSSFDANSDVLGTSGFEIRHRIVGSATYEHRWSEKQRTRFTIVYDGRSGRPYSFIGDLNVDLNGDFGDSNDLLYVPSGPEDPIVAWGNRNNRENERQAFFDFVENTPGLAAYKGQVVPRNTGRSPWTHQFDINITHEIRTWGNQKLELIFNIQNIGNLIDEGLGLEKRPKNFGRVNVLTASRHLVTPSPFVEGNENGYYVYGFEEITDRTLYYHPQGLSSRWAMQIGLRYSF